jgi:hypothetical protein
VRAKDKSGAVRVPLLAVSGNASKKILFAFRSAVEGPQIRRQVKGNASEMDRLSDSGVLCRKFDPLLR